jgi:hypothetical protein
MLSTLISLPHISIFTTTCQPRNITLLSDLKDTCAGKAVMLSTLFSLLDISIFTTTSQLRNITLLSDLSATLISLLDI